MEISEISAPQPNENETAVVGVGRSQPPQPGRLYVLSVEPDRFGVLEPWSSFVYDGSTGILSLGDLGKELPGKIVMGTAGTGTGRQSILLDSATSTIVLGAWDVGNGKVVLKNSDGTETILLDGQKGNLTLGGGTQSGEGVNGDIIIKNENDKEAIVLDGSQAMITVGGEEVNGDIIIKNENDVETIRITGADGDIEFLNADVAEEFEVDVEHLDEVLPGTVMVLDDFGQLIPCEKPYDGRLVGVIAGGGKFRPGIVLDKAAGTNRRPIALLGKTYCRVDADAGPVRPGDLLTTSARKGCAMLASDRGQAFGSVIGKALQPLAKGVALIPVLVKQQ